jgi:hypothetical protein
MTMRQVFYQATVHDIVSKTESCYDMVQNDLMLMRRPGELVYGWLADSSRWWRKPRIFDGSANAVVEGRRFSERAALMRGLGDVRNRAPRHR